MSASEDLWIPGHYNVGSSTWLGQCLSTGLQSIAISLNSTSSGNSSGLIRRSTMDHTSVPIHKAGALRVIHAHIPGYNDAVYSISIVNIVLNLAMIISVAIILRNHDPLERVTIRLAASISAADLLYSIVQILTHTETFTNKLTEIQLRTLYFFHVFGLTAVSYITTCIVVHLHLTALLNKRALARKFSPWYELIGWTAAAMTSQPVLYLFKNFRKVKKLDIIIIYDRTESDINRVVWGMYWLVAICIIYNVVICVVIALRMLPIWSRFKKSALTKVFGKMPCQLNQPDQFSIATSASYNTKKAIGDNHVPSNGLSSTVININGGGSVQFSLPARKQEMGLTINTNIGMQHNIDSEITATEFPGSALILQYQHHDSQGNDHNRLNRKDSDIKSPTNHEVGNMLISPSDTILESQEQRPLCLPSIQNDIQRNDNNDALININHQKTKIKQREIELAILRICLYPLIMIAETSTLPIYLTLPVPSARLGQTVIMTPVITGTVNFFVFLVHPQLDTYWKRLWARLKGCFICR